MITIEEIDLPPDLVIQQVYDFMTTLSGRQRTHFEGIWRPVSRFVREVKRARAAGDEPEPEPPANARESLKSAFARAKQHITADKLTQLIDNAVEKGDAQALRVLAMLAGEDLTAQPQAGTGEGAKVIVFRPYGTPLLEQGVIDELVAARITAGEAGDTEAAGEGV